MLGKMGQIRSLLKSSLSSKMHSKLLGKAFSYYSNEILLLRVSFYIIFFGFIFILLNPIRFQRVDLWHCKHGIEKILKKV